MVARKPATDAFGRPIYAYRKGPPRSRSAQLRDNPEERLQQSIAQLLEYVLPEEVVWTASLSGAQLGVQQRKKARATGLRRGCPDLVIVVPRKGPFWIEVKSETGMMSADQRRWRSAIGEARFCLARSVQDVEQALARWGIPTLPYRWSERGGIVLSPRSESSGFRLTPSGS